MNKTEKIAPMFSGSGQVRKFRTCKVVFESGFLASENTVKLFFEFLIGNRV